MNLVGDFFFFDFLVLFYWSAYFHFDELIVNYAQYVIPLRLFSLSLSHNIRTDHHFDRLLQLLSDVSLDLADVQIFVLERSLNRL